MTPVDLNQFLVDYHSNNDTISVNCQWLQTKLLNYNKLVLLSLCKDKEIESLRNRILILEATKEADEAIRSRQKYLNVGV